MLSLINVDFDRLDKVAFVLRNLVLRKFEIRQLGWNGQVIRYCKLELAIKLLLDILVEPAWMFTLSQDDLWHFFLLFRFEDRQELGHVNVF